MKKLLSSALSILMIATTFFCVPLCAWADGEGTLGAVKNPRYSSSANVTADKLKVSALDKVAAQHFRSALVARDSIIDVEFHSNVLTEEELYDYAFDMFDYAMSDELSVSCVDGDYLNYQWNSLNCGYVYHTDENKYILEYEMEYNSTADDEVEVDKVVDDFLSTIDRSDYSDYEILDKFHQYILDNCFYSEASRDRNHIAAGVFVDNEAVCQGYALAFYRLCKEFGFDVRVVESDPYEGCHAWNLVYVGDAYYYIDATWDDGDTPFGDHYYFLVDYATLQSKDSEQYKEHKLNSNVYDNDAYFNSVYRNNISEAPYDAAAKSIANCSIEVNYTNPLASVVKNSDGAELTQGKDYFINALSNESFMTVIGIGDYANTQSKRMLTVDGMQTTVSAKEVDYFDGVTAPQSSVASLSNGSDYIVSYPNIYSDGVYYNVIQGIGKYTGVEYTPFTVKKNVAYKDITLDNTEYTYDGKEKCPSVYIPGMTQGVDYTVSYADNISSGYARAIITGIGSYTGQKIVEFIIKPQATAFVDNFSTSSSATLKWNSSADASGYKVEMQTNNGFVEVGNVASPQTDYTVNSLYNYTVYYFRVRAYKNTSKGVVYSDYSPCLAVMTSFAQPSVNQIQTVSKEASSKSNVIKPSKPRKTAIKKLKTSKKSIVVYWKKVSAKGYQIQYSTNSRFKKAKIITVKGSSKTSGKIKKLKKGKKYFVRVRAYKIVNGKKLYGSWSAKKYIRVK